MEQKLISIIIPTYNRAHLIGDTLVSIQNQTYAHWECIIVDDGSTDDTEAFILKCKKQDNRISYYKKPGHLPKGPSAARNYGFSKSKGDYINWFDSDDLMHPEKLQTDLKFITSGDYDFTISQSAFFREEGKPKKMHWNKTVWSADPINDFIIKKIGWGINSPLWLRKSLIRTNLSFDESLMTADDFKYHVEALVFGLKPVIIDAVLVDLREHDNRLNDYPDKATNKLRTYFYLIEKKGDLELNIKVIRYLNWHFLKYFSSLLKAKKIKLASNVLYEVLCSNFKYKTKFKAVKLWLFGLIYCLTGEGYKFLKL
ncbi:MAG: hypothetical protein CMC55_01195 [Flavobacteriaceae bacterium]|uniref:glycosyltransferase family 2 protein n=1 Tax=Bizionia echini TaxID=649333 RepID=UPI000C8F19EC|nr:hypothetical protein [Flavobacteriaceae bacterium]|tara:strand:+ start:75 stop:1013 length:939 start_codon:yes stop_codon:yes gene_type:complete